MRLPRPFYRLPLQFDAERLAQEVAALSGEPWAEHPNQIDGNTSVRLISVDGGENDDVNGRMQPTPHLLRCQYIRQILAGFGVVWSRSRLLRLAPGAEVPEHADINYHWHYRVRLHIPIVTHPDVRFHCDGETVHMAPGEAWIFDNWRLHRVENPSPVWRVHLVADTSGSANFWRLVARANGDAVQSVPFQAEKQAMPLTEQTAPPLLMPPAEVELLVSDLASELVTQTADAQSQQQLLRYRSVLDMLCREWRQLYSLYGEQVDGRVYFERLRDSIRESSRSLGVNLMMRTNRVAAHTILEGRVLRVLVRGGTGSAPFIHTRKPTPPALRAPVFIIAAPRSGSTLLFETLAASSQIATLGGEAHWLIESIEALRPGAPGVDSNRLLAHHANEPIREQIVASILEHLRLADGSRPGDAPRLTFLEKTPKNALRVPFIDALFPDARYIFLWREPRENIASAIEAWRSGQWRTYPQLAGFTGPWSLLLPPGWRAMNGAPIAEIAAWQWERTNAIALDDLESLPAARWTHVTYQELIGDAPRTVRRLFDFLGLSVDAALEARLRNALPPSRYTLTPPDADKWRAHEADIARLLPTVQPVWNRLELLNAAAQTVSNA